MPSRQQPAQLAALQPASAPSLGSLHTPASQRSPAPQRTQVSPSLPQAVSRCPGSHRPSRQQPEQLSGMHAAPPSSTGGAQALRAPSPSQASSAVEARRMRATIRPGPMTGVARRFIGRLTMRLFTISSAPKFTTPCRNARGSAISGCARHDGPFSGARSQCQTRGIPIASWRLSKSNTHATVWNTQPCSARRRHVAAVVPCNHRSRSLSRPVAASWCAERTRDVWLHDVRASRSP